MIYRRERPKIRKFLNELLDDYGWSSKELYDFTHYDSEDTEYIPVFSMSSTRRIQLRKMIEEDDLNVSG